MGAYAVNVVLRQSALNFDFLVQGAGIVSV